MRTPDCGIANRVHPVYGVGMTKNNAKHRIRWFVWLDGERIPRESAMRGQWGYDAECSCGWQTRTGGAVQRHIRDQVWLHKLEHGPNRVVAVDRREHEMCECGTTGCCIDHTRSDNVVSCDTW